MRTVICSPCCTCVDLSTSRQSINASKEERQVRLKDHGKTSSLAEPKGEKVVRKVSGSEAGHLVVLDQPEGVAVRVARWDVFVKR